MSIREADEIGVLIWPSLRDIFARFAEGAAGRHPTAIPRMGSGNAGKHLFTGILIFHKIVEGAEPIESVTMFAAFRLKDESIKCSLRIGGEALVEDGTLEGPDSVIALSQDASDVRRELDGWLSKIEDFLRLQRDFIEGHLD